MQSLPSKLLVKIYEIYFYKKKYKGNALELQKQNAIDVDPINFSLKLMNVFQVVPRSIIKKDKFVNHAMQVV